MQQENKIQKENKMGVMSMKKLVFTMSIPMILSMVLQALYNIVDSAFVSNMPENGELALNALTLAFPVQVLMIAVGIGTGVGANALLSKSLGMNDEKKVSLVSGNTIFLGIIIFTVFLLFGIFGASTYISTQTSNPVIFEMALGYIRICCIISFGNVFFAVFEKLLQATGLSIYSTIAMITGAVINIVLDPILIYGIFGMPKMGVNGAAYATVIGQIVSAALAFVFHLKFNKSVKNKLIFLKPSKKIIKEIYAIGLPAIIAQAVMSFMTYGFNIILVRVDESMVTAYGLYYKIQQFVLFAAFGLRDAITPIVSFNHGKRDKKRVMDGIKFGVLFTTLIMILGMIVIESAAAPFSKLFGLSETTESLCISAMRIISISFIFAGINIAFQGVFQALNGGMESLIISVCRQLIFVLPTAWVFSKAAIANFDKAWTVWLTFPLAESITVILSCIIMKHIYDKSIKHI